MSCDVSWNITNKLRPLYSENILQKNEMQAMVNNRKQYLTFTWKTFETLFLKIISRRTFL